MKTSSAFQVPSPVVLSAACSVVSGSNASPDMSVLTYPYRKAVLIDEIRFDMWATDTGQFNMGSFIYAKFQLGQYYLMREPVPVWLLGTQMAISEEELQDVFVSPAEVVSHYRWRLAEPLYVEPGQVLQPWFNRVPVPGVSTPAGNIQVQVSYAGRVVPPNFPRPKTIVLPFAASFVTPLSASAVTFDQSNENDLFNPFDKPIFVQRLTGRLMVVAPGAPATINSSPGLTAAPDPSAVANVLIDDSWGGKVVNNYTGPGDVFDAERSAWTVDTVMPAKGQYNVRAMNIPINQSIHIGMIGSRQEVLP